MSSLPLLQSSYETVWSELNFAGGSQEALEVDLRSFRDPYIRASSITLGCSTLHTRETVCFPTDSKTDMNALTLSSRIFLAAIIVTIIEVLVAFARPLHRSWWRSSCSACWCAAACASPTPSGSFRMFVTNTLTTETGFLTRRRTPSRSSRTLHSPRAKTAATPPTPSPGGSR